MQPCRAPHFEDIPFFMDEHLMLDGGLKDATRDPAKVAFCRAFAAHGIGLRHLLEGCGAIPDLCNYCVSEGTGDPAAEYATVDQVLAHRIHPLLVFPNHFY